MIKFENSGRGNNPHPFLCLRPCLIYCMFQTYATDKYVPDSASTATAFLCGVKTRYEAVGVDGSIVHGNCSSVPGTELRCIGEWAMAEGNYVLIIFTNTLYMFFPKMYEKN